MKKLLNIFFVTLGFIFFLIILGGIYMYIADPYNIKPLFQLMISSQTSSEMNSDAETSNSVEGGGSFSLTQDQKDALDSFGVDPESIPSELTPEQEACFTDALGEKRVAEIEAGDIPTATEFFKARGCL